MQTRLNVVGYHSQFPQFEVYCEIPTYDGSKKETWFSYLGSIILSVAKNLWQTDC